MSEKKEEFIVPKANSNPQWGRMLTKQELLDLMDRIYAKQKERKDKEK
jgi:hypothetical protein